MGIRRLFLRARRTGCRVTAVLPSQELDMIDAHGEGARVHFADPPANVLDETPRQATAHVIARLRMAAHASQDVLERRVMKEIESAQVVERIRTAMAPLLEQRLQPGRNVGVVLVGAPILRVLALRYAVDRKSTRLNSSHLVISYAVFC